MKCGRLVSKKRKRSNPKTCSRVNASYSTLSNAGYTYSVYNHQGKTYQQNPLTPFLQKEHFFSIIPNPEENLCALSQITQLCFQEPCLQSPPLSNLTDDRAAFIANFNRQRRGCYSQHVASANEVSCNVERTLTTSDGQLPVFCIVL